MALVEELIIASRGDHCDGGPATRSDGRALQWSSSWLDPAPLPLLSLSTLADVGRVHAAAAPGRSPCSWRGFGHPPATDGRSNHQLANNGSGGMVLTTTEQILLVVVAWCESSHH